MEKKTIKMSDEARALKNAYQREWARNNRDKVNEQIARYWEKRPQRRERKGEADYGDG